MNLSKKKLIEIKSKAPLFIVGCQRSGTTMLYRILSEALGIGFGRDNTFFMNFRRTIEHYGDLSKIKNLRNMLGAIEKSPVFQKRFDCSRINCDDFIDCLEKTEYDDIVRTIYAYWALRQGKVRWGGKTPDYSAHMKFLTELFPDIKIIHIIRDGRDVALSFLQRRWGPKDPYIAATYWKKRVERGSAGKQLFDDICLEIKYEDLLQSPQKTFQNIVHFLNYNELDYNQIVNKFSENIIPTIKANNTDKWKTGMNDRDICAFEIVAGDMLHKYGYEICNKNYQQLKINYLEKKYHYLKDIIIRVRSGHILRYLKRSKHGFQFKYGSRDQI